MEDNNAKTERIALTTSQAAEYCFVSTGTIQNWLKAGRLEGQRTAGGQFRIRIDELRRFMLDKGMSVQALDNDYYLHRRCFCWEYFAGQKAEGFARVRCEQCIVHRSSSMNCFALTDHPDHKRQLCKKSCAECAYHRAFAGTDDGEAN